MEANRKLGEEPPGDQNVAESVEGNESPPDDDVELAKDYVRRHVMNSWQRKLLRTIDGEPKLLSVAKQLNALPDMRRRIHPDFCAIRSSHELLCIKAFWHYTFLIGHHVDQLKGPHGERHRQEYQHALGFGDGT